MLRSSWLFYLFFNGLVWLFRSIFQLGFLLVEPGIFEHQGHRSFLHNRRGTLEEDGNFIELDIFLIP